jgi:hypothetical protein
MSIPTEHVLSTAAWIKRLAYTIAVIGTVASYGTQVALLLAYGVGRFGFVIPGTVDLLAVCAAMALQLPDLDPVTRWMAGAVLTVAVAVSVAANITGGHNAIARIAHAWPVVAYLLGELLANRVRTYAARLIAAAGPVHATATVTPVPVPAITPATVSAPAIVNPAPAIVAPAATATRPRTRTAAATKTTSNTVTVPVKNSGQPYSERHARRLRTGR